MPVELVARLSNLPLSITEAHLRELLPPRVSLREVLLPAPRCWLPCPTGRAALIGTTPTDTKQIYIYLHGAIIDGNRLNVALAKVSDEPPPRGVGGDHRPPFSRDVREIGRGEQILNNNNNNNRGIPMRGSSALINKKERGGRRSFSDEGRQGRTPRRSEREREYERRNERERGHERRMERGKDRDNTKNEERYSKRRDTRYSPRRHRSNSSLVSSHSSRSSSASAYSSHHNHNNNRRRRHRSNSSSDISSSPHRRRRRYSSKPRNSVRESRTRSPSWAE